MRYLLLIVLLAGCNPGLLGGPPVDDDDSVEEHRDDDDATSDDDDATPDDDDSVVDDDDDATSDDDDTVEVPIPPSCDGELTQQWVHFRNTATNGGEVGPETGTFEVSSEENGGAFTGDAGAGVAIFAGEQALLPWADYAAEASVTAFAASQFNETYEHSRGALWSADGALLLQAGVGFWEDVPGDAWQVSRPADGDCPVEPTGWDTCWTNRRTIPVRFERGADVVWLYPGQEATVGGMRVVLLRAIQQLDLVDDDKCGPPYILEWYAVPAP